MPSLGVTATSCEARAVGSPGSRSREQVLGACESTSGAHQGRCGLVMPGTVSRILADWKLRSCRAKLDWFEWDVSCRAGSQTFQALACFVFLRSEPLKESRKLRCGTRKFHVNVLETSPWLHVDQAFYETLMRFGQFLHGSKHCGGLSLVTWPCSPFHTWSTSWGSTASHLQRSTNLNSRA